MRPPGGRGESGDGGDGGGGGGDGGGDGYDGHLGSIHLGPFFFAAFFIWGIGLFGFQAAKSTLGVQGDGSLGILVFRSCAAGDQVNGLWLRKKLAGWIAQKGKKKWTSASKSPGCAWSLQASVMGGHESNSMGLRGARVKTRYGVSVQVALGSMGHDHWPA